MCELDQDPDVAHESSIELFKIAEQFIAKGGVGDAIEYYRRSLAADGEFLDSARGLVVALRRNGQHDQAEIVARVLSEHE